MSINCGVTVILLIRFILSVLDGKSFGDTYRFSLGYPYQKPQHTLKEINVPLFLNIIPCHDCNSERCIVQIQDKAWQLEGKPHEFVGDLEF